MTIIQSNHDFDTRILFNSPLLFLLYITNPKLSPPIYNQPSQTPLPLQKKNKVNALASSKFENHEIAIRTQYFLEWRLISICFLITILSCFSLNPSLLFFVTITAEQGGHPLEPFYASLIFPFFYGSCILSLFVWMLLYRLPVWNMGIFASESTTNDRMQIINFKRNSYESQINGYSLCLRWLLFGFTISLYLLSISDNYYHSFVAICMLGIFYPNLLLTSSSVLIYAIHPLDSVTFAHRFIAVCIVIGWTLVPFITALLAQLLNYWTPFLFIGAGLSICILYLMCFGASQQTKSQIMSSENDSDDDTVPLTALKADDALSSMIFDAMNTENEYQNIDNENNDDCTWSKGCPLWLKYNPSIMASSMGMFQITTFLLNIESFLIHICLSIYLCWFCVSIHNDLDQTFILSSLQMCLTGVCIIACVVFASRYMHNLYYFYSFRILINMGCIVLCIVMSSQYNVVYLYWILLPVIVTLIVLLNVSTNLIIARNTQHGCYTFINASNQMFKLIAFMIGPLLMGLLTKTEDGRNLHTFWNIIINVLSIQLSLTITVTFIQGFVKCFCAQSDRSESDSA